MLNPVQVPDDRYLTGLPEGDAEPEADETWFAVFLRIENKTDAAAPSAEDFEIEDTEGDGLRARSRSTRTANPFAYAADASWAPRRRSRIPDSSQELDSTAGAMLLFKTPAGRATTAARSSSSSTPPRARRPRGSR